MADPFSRTFDPPLELDGVKLASLELREPLTKEVLAAEKSASAMQGIQASRQRDFALVALVGGISEGFVRAMRVSDSVAAIRYLDGFVNAPDDKVDEKPEPELEIPIVPAVTIHNLVCDLLELREPTGAEMDAAYKEMGAGVTGHSLRKFQVMLVARVSGHNRAVIEALPITIVNQASKYLMGFT